MKRILLFLVMAFTLISFADNTSFCDGFETGYCEGYKDVKGQNTVCPVTPVCPVPELGKNTYNGGYNTGFKKGRKKANE